MQAQPAVMSFKGGNPVKPIVIAAKTAKTNSNSNKPSVVSILMKNLILMGKSINNVFIHIADTSSARSIKK